MSDTVKRYAAGGPQIKLLLADEHLVLAADLDALQARHDALIETILSCRDGFNSIARVFGDPRFADRYDDEGRCLRYAKMCDAALKGDQE